MRNVMILAALCCMGCDHELDLGTYSVPLVGTAYTHDGVEVDFDQDVEIAIGLNADRPKDRYEMRLCDGFTDFDANTNDGCLIPAIILIETTNDFAGSFTYPFDHDVEWEGETLACDGNEMISADGHIKRDGTGTIHITYLATLFDTADAACADAYAERLQDIDASGPLILTDGE